MRKLLSCVMVCFLALCVAHAGYEYGNISGEMTAVYNYAGGAMVSMHDLARDTIIHYSNGNISSIESLTPDIGAVNAALGTDFTSFEQFWNAVNGITDGESGATAAQIAAVQAAGIGYQDVEAGLNWIHDNGATWVTTEYIYGEDGSLAQTRTQVVDENGAVQEGMWNVTNFENGQKVSASEWVFVETAYLEDENGQYVQDVNDEDGDGDTEEYVVDPTGQTGWVEKTATWTYDDNGILLSASGALDLIGVQGAAFDQGTVTFNADGTIDKAYNEAGLLIAEYSYSGGNLSQVKMYGYETITDEETGETSYKRETIRTTKYDFNAKGQMLGVKSYNSAGKLTSDVSYVYAENGALLMTVENVLSNTQTSTSIDIAEGATEGTQTTNYQSMQSITYFVCGKQMFTTNNLVATWSETDEINTHTYDPWTQGQVVLNAETGLYEFHVDIADVGDDFYNYDPTKQTGATTMLDENGEVTTDPSKAVTMVFTLGAEESCQEKLAELAASGAEVKLLWTCFSTAAEAGGSQAILWITPSSVQTQAHMNGNENYAGDNADLVGGDWEVGTNQWWSMM